MKFTNRLEKKKGFGEIKYLSKDKDDDRESLINAFAIMLNNILYVILFVSFSICSTTFLWRIERSPPAYIFGSIHVPYNLIWPYVSNETRQAFLSSTHFYAEIDAKNDAYWDGFLQCLINRSRRLNRSLDEREILDLYLSVEARRLNKTVGSLEAPEYHCEREAWRYNLTTWRIILEHVKKEMKNRTWSSNDRKNSLGQSTIKKYLCDEISGSYIQTLYKSKKDIHHVEQRDEQMSKNIHTLLHRSKNDRYFFAIGAAHMLGKHRNVIIRLRKLGHKITRVCTKRNYIKKKLGCEKQTMMKHCVKNHL